MLLKHLFKIVIFVVSLKKHNSKKKKKTPNKRFFTFFFFISSIPKLRYSFTLTHELIVLGNSLCFLFHVAIFFLKDSVCFNIQNLVSGSCMLFRFVSEN